MIHLSNLGVEFCISNVMRVDIPGQMQLFAIIAYLNSSSHTKNSSKKTWQTNLTVPVCL